MELNDLWHIRFSATWEPHRVKMMPYSSTHWKADGVAYDTGHLHRIIAQNPPGERPDIFCWQCEEGSPSQEWINYGRDYYGGDCVTCSNRGYSSINCPQCGTKIEGLFCPCGQNHKIRNSQSAECPMCIRGAHLPVENFWTPEDSPSFKEAVHNMVRDNHGDKIASMMQRVNDSDTDVITTVGNEHIPMFIRESRDWYDEGEDDSCLSHRIMLNLNHPDADADKMHSQLIDFFSSRNSKGQDGRFEHFTLSSFTPNDYDGFLFDSTEHDGYRYDANNPFKYHIQAIDDWFSKGLIDESQWILGLYSTQGEERWRSRFVLYRRHDMSVLKNFLGWLNGEGSSSPAPKKSVAKAPATKKAVAKKSTAKKTTAKKATAKKSSAKKR